MLQISNYWKPGAMGTLTCCRLRCRRVVRRARGRKSAAPAFKALAAHLPQRLADAWAHAHAPEGGRQGRRAMDSSELDNVAAMLKRWSLRPSGTLGYKKAEVTLGGVDTRALSQTMEARAVPGLHFIGEVVDVTGWLGGYNFQWAWASAAACAEAL